MFTEDYIFAVLKNHDVDLENEEMKKLAFALVELFQATDQTDENE